MDKFIKNKMDLKLVTSPSSCYKKKLGKFFLLVIYYLIKFDGVI